MNVVTGATGIIGSHVALWLLENGEQVIACKQANSDVSKTAKLFSYYGRSALFDKLEWRDISLSDIFSLEEVFNGTEKIYHCAGFVSFDPAQRKKLFAVNSTGTANVVHACMNFPGISLCHVSTIATINNADYKSTLDENVFWKKSGKESDYALSKYSAEREVWRGMEEGLHAVIVNPGVVLSPGFWNQSSSQLFKQCHLGNNYYTQGMAAYVAAADCAKAMTQLMNHRHFGKRYILSEGNYPLRDILDMICDGLHVPRPQKNAGRGLLKKAAFLETISRFFTGRERKITPSLINAAFNRQNYSNERIKREIDIQFTPIHSAINEICKQYLNEQR